MSPTERTSGDPAPSAVFDCHQHYGRLFSEPGNGAGEYDPGSVDWPVVERTERIAAMDELGVERSLLMPANDYLCPSGIADTRKVNDGIRAYLDASPDRFPVGVGVAEPRHGRAALDEIRRCRDELAFVGIQYHCRFQGVATDHPRMYRHLEVIGELGMVPFVHSHADSGFEAPLGVHRLAAAFPDLPIVVLDACSGYHHSLECLALAERHPNLYFDTALAYNLMPLVELVNRFGPGRVLFGSDLYSHPHTFRTAHTPAAITAALSPDEARLVLGGNLEDLLSKAQAPR